MKYKTFRGILIGAGALVAVGVIGTCAVLGGFTGKSSVEAEPKPPAPALPTNLTQPPGPPIVPVPTTTPASSPAASAPLGAERLPLGEMERAVLARAQQNISGDKLKDALPSRPFKVNLYKEAGASAVNRAKIDLDRDDKWDEKWTIESPTQVKRQIAPADDENYTLEYRLDGDQWRKKK